MPGRCTVAIHACPNVTRLASEQVGTEARARRPNDDRRIPPKVRLPACRCPFQNTVKRAAFRHARRVSSSGPCIRRVRAAICNRPLGRGSSAGASTSLVIVAASRLIPAQGLRHPPDQQPQHDESDFDPKIKTVADMKGKRISLGLRSQSDWAVYPRMVLEPYGITPDSSDIRHLIPAALTQQLIDGSTDVTVTVFGMEPNLKEWMIGSPMRQLEASGKAAALRRRRQRDPGRGQPEMGDDLHPRDHSAQHVARAEEAAVGRQRTGLQGRRASVSRRCRLSSGDERRADGAQASGSPYLVEDLVAGAVVAGLSEENVHPGAKRAYEEIGWWSKSKNYPPMTYPT